VIAAANKIAFKPYIYGGGHGSWKRLGLRLLGLHQLCAARGGTDLGTRDSTEFESYGAPGQGRWITLWANSGHVYMQIAGLWFDTAAQSSSNSNDRWSPIRISPRGGFVERHPTGL